MDYTWDIIKEPEINVPQSIFYAVIKGKYNHFILGKKKRKETTL